jgi:hypothetical protein
VHTSPGSDREPPKVLEQGVGDVEFLLVAVDNERDRAIYVGPVYSYYEFTEDPQARLTDEEWQQRIRENRVPPRPRWTEAFRAPPQERTLEHPSYWRSDRKQEIEDKLRKVHELLRELREASEIDRASAFRATLERAAQEGRARSGAPKLELPSDAEIDGMLAAISRRPFDAPRAAEVMRSTAARAGEHCGRHEATPKNVRVTATFAPPFGAASGVQIADRRLRGTNTAVCLERIFRRASVPRFGGAPVSLSEDVALRPPELAKPR